MTGFTTALAYGILAFWPPASRSGRMNNVKVQASVKARCEKCKIIKRKGVVRVLCDNPKHKQRQR